MNNLRRPLEVSLGNDLLEKLDLRSLIYPLWLNKWLILIAIFVCFLGGLKYVQTLVPQYASNVLLQLDDRGNLFNFDKDLLSSSLFSSKGSSAIGVNTALIKSRYILESVIERLNLDLIITPKYLNSSLENQDKPHTDSDIKIVEFKVPISEENKKFTLMPTLPKHYELYDAANHLILKGEVGKYSTKMDVEKGKFSILIGEIPTNTNIEYIIIKSPMQKLVNQLSNKIKVNDLSLDLQLANPVGILKVSMAGPDPDLIIKILNTIANVLVEKKAEKKAEEATKTLEFIALQLPEIKKTLDEAESKLSTYFAKHGMIDLNSESRALLTMMSKSHENLTTLIMNKRSALLRYTPNHPYILSMLEKEKALNKDIQSLRTKLSQLPARDQKAVSLLRDVKVKSQLYLVMLNKIQALKITKGGMISDVSILGLATYPDKPLPNGARSILLFSILLGFVIGASLIYIQRLWNRKVSDPSIIENEFNLPNMAIIPYSDKQIKPSKSGKKQIIPLLAHIDPKSLSIEALRSFRTSAQFSMMDAKNNIITITGVSPGVGKSFVSVNFAFLQADSGKRILLIDGDMRKGHLKDYFSLDASLGLSEVICGAATFEEALVSGPHSNLYFLPTGKYPYNPSELLLSNRFKELLEKISQKYDLIIIDTPPILAVTDASIIARHAGANFLILASNTHEIKEIDLALKRLNSNGISINGTIFNFSEKQKALYRNSNIPNYQYQYEYK